MKADISLGFKGFLLFLLTVILTVNGCKKNTSATEDQLIGTWRLSGETIDGSLLTLSACEEQYTLEFQLQNLCIISDSCNSQTSYSGWSYKDGMLNISVQLPAAYYIDLLEAESLTLKRYDITSSGELQTTTLAFTRVN